MINFLKLLFLTVILFLSNCADPPPGLPLVTGDIIVSCELTTSDNQTVQPEFVEVVLDGDSLGLHENPVKLKYIEVGEHFISSFANVEGTFYRSSPQRLVVAYQSNSELMINLTSSGALCISGIAGNESVDSFYVELDGVKLGVINNSGVIPIVSEGPHKIKISFASDTLMYEGWESELEVIVAETTYAEIEMICVSPFEDCHAPDISCLDFDGNNRFLFDHWGEAIFLYFFKST